MQKKQIPVTIITGFLGAGKTTLLNEILRNHKNTNFLIIENEAGNINIDSRLIHGNAKSSVFELTGGCICCSLSTELGTVLNSVILSGTKYDHLLIEATGMADSGQIINLFSGARVQRYFSLDAVVALVDAGSFLKRLTNFNEVRSQIAKSDIIIINKCDLLANGEMEKLKQKLISINPIARIEKTTHAKVENIRILNSGSFSPSKIEQDLINYTNLTYVNSNNGHAHEIQTLSYTLPGYFEIESMSRFFEEFLNSNGDKVLRIKAILNIHAMDSKVILQSVGDNYYTSQGSKWDENEIRESKIVFIGTGLKEEVIKKNLDELLKINPIEK